MDLWIMYLIGFIYLLLIGWFIAGDRAGRLVRRVRGRPDPGSLSAREAERDLTAAVRRGAYPAGKIDLVEVIRRDGEALFGEPVYVALNARITDFIELSAHHDRMRASGWTVDLLVLDGAGRPRLAVQTGRPPRPDAPMSGYAGHAAMTAAGLPIAYLGRAPSTELLRSTVREMRRSGAIA